MKNKKSKHCYCFELRDALYKLYRLVIIEQLVTPDIDEVRHAMEVLTRHDSANQSV